MSAEWRSHPRLQGRFHPQFPDDVQVVVHDGGPRMTERRPELAWVRIVGFRDGVYTGRVLNRPHQLVLLKESDEIQFVVPERGEHPLQVRDKYLRERGNWNIHPCGKCGLSELFDAPSDLIRKVFPDTPPDAVMEAFTARCGACGGGVVVESRNSGPHDQPPHRKPWWRFWT